MKYRSAVLFGRGRLAPVDDEGDYARPIWAGVLPLQEQALAPTADPRLAPGIEVPPHVAAYRRIRQPR